MSEKLVRNISEKRWREYWKAVDAAASNAPKLRYHDTAREPRRCDVSRLTAERLRQEATYRQGLYCDVALLEHAARVVEAAEQVARLWRHGRVRAVGNGFAGPVMDQLDAALEGLDSALEWTDS